MKALIKLIKHLYSEMLIQLEENRQKEQDIEKLSKLMKWPKHQARVMYEEHGKALFSWMVYGIPLNHAVMFCWLGVESLHPFTLTVSLRKLYEFLKPDSDFDGWTNTRGLTRVPMNYKDNGPADYRIDLTKARMLAMRVNTNIGDSVNHCLWEYRPALMRKRMEKNTNKAKESKNG